MYYGTIRTKAQALALAGRLRKNNGSEKAIGAAQVLEKNWHAIAARPEIQPEIIAMAETTPLWRPDSIVNKIIARGKK